MNLIIIRHAVAISRETYAKTHSDDLARPLSKDGSRKFKQSLKSLRKILPSIDFIAYSPFTRTWQTAEIIRKAYKIKKHLALRHLAPEEDYKKIIPWLKTNRRYQNIAIVGHEPGLNFLISCLLTGEKKYFIELKKGGVCSLTIDKFKAGNANLNWLLQPKQIRDLA